MQCTDGKILDALTKKTSMIGGREIDYQLIAGLNQKYYLSATN